MMTGFDQSLMLAPIFVRNSKTKFHESFSTCLLTYLTDGSTMLRTRHFYTTDLPQILIHPDSSITENNYRLSYKAVTKYPLVAWTKTTKINRTQTCVIKLIFIFEKCIPVVFINNHKYKCICGYIVYSNIQQLGT
jgi:hypothetical protein